MNPNPIRRKLSIGVGAILCSIVLTGSSKATVVAVIDTGIDTAHPALKPYLWKNPGETGLDAQGRDKATNRRDDDGNGFVDDVHGWNFAGDNADIRDRHGHGTHVAGLIAAPGGLRTPANELRLMILKYYESDRPASANLAPTVRAIRYATEMGARIINYSGGGEGFDGAEEAAIRAAALRGMLFVAAAGNDKSDSDRKRYYPANYGLPNILSVAAVDDGGRLLASSNFGRLTVDLAAPGSLLLSTMPGGNWGRMTGTSQAAAVASGAAARLWEKRSDLRAPADVIAELVRRGTPEKTLREKTRYQVRLDPAVFDKI